jgi:hypothetical protein
MGIRDRAKDIFSTSIEPATDVLASIFLDGVVGSVVPGGVNAMLAYRQRKFERNMILFMELSKARGQEFNEKLNRLSDSQIARIKETYFGIVSDYAGRTVQEEKINYIVNGFVSIAELDNPKEDIVLMYFDMLDQLTLLDIKVLVSYTKEVTHESVQEKFGVEIEQLRMVKEKLKRLGLIHTSADENFEEMYTNVVKITSFLNDSFAGKNVSPKFGRLSHYKFVRPTPFAKELLEFFKLDN